MMDPAREGEQRIGYWRGARETAWIAREPASRYHERPSNRLPALVRQVCLARGSDAAPPAARRQWRDALVGFAAWDSPAG